jgi:hypothetical protein
LAHASHAVALLMQKKVLLIPWYGDRFPLNLGHSGQARSEINLVITFSQLPYRETQMD